jgi:hypothetical protein
VQPAGVSSANSIQSPWPGVEIVSIFCGSRILSAMKNRLRNLAQLALLFFLFSGCSEEVRQSPGSAKVALSGDPVARVIEVFAESDRLLRTEKLISLLRAFPTDQANRFEEVLDGINFPNRELDRALVISAWAKQDPVAATKWAKHHERSDIVRSSMYSDSVYLWALKDPESFLADMEMAVFAATGFNSSALKAFIRGWFDSGKPGLETYIRDLRPQSEDRQRAIDTLAKIRVERDGAAATIEWAKTLRGDKRYKAAVYARVAAKAVTHDSDAVVEWCAEVCDSKVGEEMPHFIAAAWVRKSGEDAMDFIVAQPDRISVRTGARAAYRHFVVSDPDRALAWMDTTTDEQRRGPVLQGPVWMYVNERSTRRMKMPLVAIEWTDYIQSESERESAFIMIARRWLDVDETAAEAWMAGSSMSEEAKLAAHRNNVPRSKKR